MAKNILLKSLVDQELGVGTETSGENVAYHCVKCNHKRLIINRLKRRNNTYPIVKPLIFNPLPWFFRGLTGIFIINHGK